jgi:hypothetical protein
VGGALNGKSEAFNGLGIGDGFGREFLCGIPVWRRETAIFGEGLDKPNSKAKIPEIPANLPSIAFTKGSASRIYDFEAVLAAFTAKSALQASTRSNCEPG